MTGASAGCCTRPKKARDPTEANERGAGWQSCASSLERGRGGVGAPLPPIGGKGAKPARLRARLLPGSRRGGRAQNGTGGGGDPLPGVPGAGEQGGGCSPGCSGVAGGLLRGGPGGRGEQAHEQGVGRVVSRALDTPYLLAHTATYGRTRCPGGTPTVTDEHRPTDPLAELAAEGDRVLRELLEQDREGLAELYREAAEGGRVLNELMREQAEQDRELVGELVSDGGHELVRRDDQPSAEQLVAAWLEQYSGHTADAYRRDLQLWLTYCAEQGWEPVTAHRVQVQRWVRDLHDRYRPGTVARRLTALRSWYGWLVDEQLVSVSPAARVRLLAPVPSRVPSGGPGLEQARQLLAATERLTLRDQLVLGLLLLLGLRASEVGQLRADELRRERGHLLLTVHGKGGTQHDLPVPGWLGERLERWTRDHSTGPLITDERGAPLTRWQVRRTVERACRHAGLPPVNPHALRHSCVTLALESGVPLHRVQDLARHASPATTRRYDDAAGRLDGHGAYALAGALVGAA